MNVKVDHSIKRALFPHRLIKTLNRLSYACLIYLIRCRSLPKQPKHCVLHNKSVFLLYSGQNAVFFIFQPNVGEIKDERRESKKCWKSNVSFLHLSVILQEMCSQIGIFQTSLKSILKPVTSHSATVTVFRHLDIFLFRLSSIMALTFDTYGNR